MKLIGDLFRSDPPIDSKLSFDLAITGLTASTQNISEGCLFFALRGQRVDGHDFAKSALDRGAIGSVVDRPEIYSQISSAILVPSSSRSLGLTASHWFDNPTQTLKLVGVTGTKGKTTTTYLLRSMLEHARLKSGLIGTVEYAWGSHRENAKLTTPDSGSLQSSFAQMVKEEVTHAVMEVSSIALDQNRVCGCVFDVGIFTNLSQDHLDYHHDFETYFAAKKKLFTEVPVRVGIINGDDPWGRRLVGELALKNCLRYSLKDKSSDFFFECLEFGKGGLSGRLRSPNGTYDIASPLIGTHNAYNLLAALAGAFSLGVDFPVAVEALKGAKGAPGRLERIDGGEGSPMIFVDYAHKPKALESVLMAARSIVPDPTSQIITVVGCGGDRDRLKRPIMGEIASQFSDITILTSDNPRTEPPEAIINDMEKGILQNHRYYRESDRRAAIYLALDLAGEKDLVLIAGKGHETYQILLDREIPFDDREVVRDYFQNTEK